MSELNILHIGQDEKFINAARYLFNKAFPGANTFVVIKPPADPPLQFVDPWPELIIEVHKQDTLDKLLELSASADIVVLHGIDKLKGALILAYPEKEKFLGIFYGSEVYNEHILGENYLGEKSEQVYHKLNKPSLFSILKWIYRSIRHPFYGKEYQEIDMKEVFNAIKVYAAFSSDQHREWAKQGIIDPNHHIIHYSYYPLEFIFKDPDLRATGNNILLGNSASVTNNHLEAFDILRQLNLGERKVFTPLSYGLPKYSKVIEMVGKEALSPNFVALTEFLPLAQYNELLTQCGIVIMNHYRTEGIGNLIAALYMGAKVFVNKTDAYRFFKGIGCHIYLIEEDLLNRGEQAFELIDSNQVRQNRKVLEKYFSEKVLVRSLQQGLKEHFQTEKKGLPHVQNKEI